MNNFLAMNPSQIADANKQGLAMLACCPVEHNPQPTTERGRRRAAKRKKRA